MGLNINVGCGATPTIGWVNFDNSLSLLLKPLVRLNLLPARQRNLVEAAQRGGVRHASAVRLPLPVNSVSVVYSSHMLEHLDRVEAEKFLEEAHRVLEPGGIIRLALPDLRLKIEDYNRGHDADAFIESILMGTTRARTARQWLQHIIVGPRHHLWMYDADSLVKLLSKKGFSNAIILKAGDTTIPAPGGLDLSERSEESFYVEARR